MDKKTKIAFVNTKGEELCTAYDMEHIPNKEDLINLDEFKLTNTNSRDEWKGIWQVLSKCYYNNLVVFVLNK